MITLESNRLSFRFPEVHVEARCSIEFERTLRIPDDGKDYFLPPGLGSFPLRHLDDYAGRLPEDWLQRGGVLAPMHQAEALWIRFEIGSRRSLDYPFAVKIATGKICALTGDDWVNHLNRDPQDYVVLPEQPWLDGYCVEKGVIRQFVAMPLGQGYTVEEQITGAARHGGLQIVVYPMKPERYEALVAARESEYSGRVLHDQAPMELACGSPGMGLAPGGRMKQDIHDDPYGLDAWDQRHAGRCFVSIVNSSQWMAITGERPPTEPPTAKEYTEMGLPWFDYYGGDAQAIAGAEKLKAIKSVAQVGKERGRAPLPGNESVEVKYTIPLRKEGSKRVRETAGW